MSKHKRGTGNKPGVLRLIAPEQAVKVIGRTIRGPLTTYTVRTESGHVCEVDPDWIGGKELADQAYDATRNEAISSQQQLQAAQLRQQETIKRLRLEAAANGGAA